MNTNENTIPHFVINLPSSTERRQCIKERFRAIGIAPAFFDAIDGRSFDVANHPNYAPLRRRLFFGKDLTGGEIGCLLSHRAVFQKMIDQNNEHAAVFEDDAVLAPDFPNVVHALMNIKESWDIIRFLDDKKVYRKNREVSPLTNKHDLIRFKGTPGCAYAYLINQKAARVLIEHTEKNFLPIDILMGHAWRMGLETFAVSPSPAWNDESFDSTIGATRFDKDVKLSGWQRGLFPLTRVVWNIYNLFVKRVGFLIKRNYDRDLREKLKRHSPNAKC